jgi:hypothetical protein
MTTRQQLRDLVPRAYLQQGYRDSSGLPRPELRGAWAVAAAEQLRAAGVTPAQLDTGVAAVSRVALVAAHASEPLSDLSPLFAALKAARPAPAVSALLIDCIACLKNRNDLHPFVEHLLAVLSMLSLNGALVQADQPLIAPASMDASKR